MGDTLVVVGTAASDEEYSRAVGASLRWSLILQSFVTWQVRLETEPQRLWFWLHGWVWAKHSVFSVVVNIALGFLILVCGGHVVCIVLSDASPWSKRQITIPPPLPFYKRKAWQDAPPFSSAVFGFCGQAWLLLLLFFIRTTSTWHDLAWWLILLCTIMMRAWW